MISVNWLLCFCHRGRVGERVWVWHVLYKGGGNKGTPGRRGGPQAVGQQRMSHQGGWINNGLTLSWGVSVLGYRCWLWFCCCWCVCLGGGHLHGEAGRLDLHLTVLLASEKERLHPRSGHLLQHRVHPLSQEDWLLHQWVCSHTPSTPCLCIYESDPFSWCFHVSVTIYLQKELYCNSSRWCTVAGVMSKWPTD